MNKVTMNRKFVILLICVVEFVLSDDSYRLKYEYKYSFKGPNLSQSDKSVPFWNTSGDAVPSHDSVRVVPSLRGKKGAVWSKYPFTHNAWQLDVSFRILGRGKVGADGLAVWFVETPSHGGPVFGSMDMWKGMGLFFDSFDNDGKRNNPYVTLIVNDGTMSYSHSTDGYEQKNGGCLRDFRNRPYPTKARIIYWNNRLQVLIDSGFTKEEDFEECTTVDNVKLPQPGYFGVSAATGGLADDHDVHKFLVWSLYPKQGETKEDEDQPGQKNKEEMKRLQEEYEKNLQSFMEEQKKFKEEHPDKVKEEFTDVDDMYEDFMPEFKAVMDVQNKVKDELSKLRSSMIMVLEKQERIISRLDEKSPPDANLAKSHEIENVMKIQRVTRDSVHELENHLNFLKTTTLALSDNVANLNVPDRAAAAGDNIASKSYEQQKFALDIQERLDVMRNSLVSIEAKQGKQPKLSCPSVEIPSCVTFAGLIIVAVIQVAILLAYHIIKQSREAAAKKFF
ncbi:protein ERGIC-53-like isoform X1 [Clavelina lepadiformis]|uniref:protein ERGIC-53-like isoform X1 n=1 Tax=Clavelina lepadiformis TaxID=159417 RepID=UPI0040429152